MSWTLLANVAFLIGSVALGVATSINIGLELGWW